MLDTLIRFMFCYHWSTIHSSDIVPEIFFFIFPQAKPSQICYFYIFNINFCTEWNLHQTKEHNYNSRRYLDLLQWFKFQVTGGIALNFIQSPTIILQVIQRRHYQLLLCKVSSSNVRAKREYYRKLKKYSFFFFKSQKNLVHSINDKIMGSAANQWENKEKKKIKYCRKIGI